MTGSAQQLMSVSARRGTPGSARQLMSVLARRGTPGSARQRMTGSAQQLMSSVGSARDSGVGSAADDGVGSAADDGVGSAADASVGSAVDVSVGSAADVRVGSAADVSVGSAADASAGSAGVRDRLVEALQLDLVGPDAGHALAEERLRGWERPSNWYLTGFLVPSGTPYEFRSDADEDEPLDETPAVAGRAEESTEERVAAKKGFFPSSIGLSFLVSAAAEKLTVTVRWGDYEKTGYESSSGAGDTVWQRHPQERVVPVPLSGDSADYALARSGGLKLHVAVRSVDTGQIAGFADGTRSVSVFIINNRPVVVGSPDDPESAGRAERSYVFQAELEIAGVAPFVPRRDPGSAAVDDWDDRVAGLHYVKEPEYAVGHGVSADWDVADDGRCRVLRTAWIPDATVAETETVAVPDVVLSMDVLGSLSGGAAVGEALMPLVGHYRSWIAAQRAGLGTLSGEHEDTAEGTAETRRDRRRPYRARRRDAGRRRRRSRCFPYRQPRGGVCAPPAS